MKISHRPIRHRVVAIGATLALSAGFGLSTQPASAAGTASAYRVQRLETRSGQVFLPSTTGNPVSDHGRVAGTVQIDGLKRAAVFRLGNRTVMVLKKFSGLRTEATDVNDRGEVSGNRYASDGTARGFVWSIKSGKVRLLKQAGSGITAIAVNNTGTVVGSGGSQTDGVIWQGRRGRMQRLEINPSAINNRGWVAGVQSYRDDDFRRAVRPVVWRPGKAMVKLRFLSGDDSSLVTGLNDRGQVVGTSMNVGEEDELFGAPVVWTVSGRKVCRLHRPGDLEIPSAISDRGRVVGSYLQSYDDAGEDRSYRAVTWTGCGAAAVTLPSSGPAAAYGMDHRGKIVGVGDAYLSSTFGVRWLPRSH